MTKQILQSLKIFRLATVLARFDLLSLIDSPNTRLYFLWGKIFCRANQADIKEKIQLFLSSEVDEAQKIFVSEIEYEKVDFLPARPPLKEQNISPDEVEALTILFRKLAYFHPRLRAALPTFVSRTNVIQDKRLAASEIEEYLALSGKVKDALIYEVNWKETNKQKLKIIYPPLTEKEKELTPTNQKTLINIWSNLFFEDNTLLWHWQGIQTSTDGKSGFSYPDCLLTITDSIKNFAIEFIRTNKSPQTYLEYKTVLALNQLKRLCPKVKLNQELSSFCQKRYKSSGKKSEDNTQTIDNMIQAGFTVPLKPKVELTPYSKIKDLQTMHRYGKEKEFRNSSPLLFLLLAAMIYALLKYF